MKVRILILSALVLLVSVDAGQLDIYKGPIDLATDFRFSKSNDWKIWGRCVQRFKNISLWQAKFELLNASPPNFKQGNTKPVTIFF